MFSRSNRSRSRAIAANVGEIERRLRTLEKHLERIGGNTSKNTAQAVDRIGETADRVADTVATALSTMAERFRDDGIFSESSGPDVPAGSALSAQQRGLLTRSAVLQ